MDSKFKFFFLSLIVIALDQTSKYWALLSLKAKTDLSLINGLLKFSYAENPGIAFSILSDTGGELKVWLLAAVSLAAIGMVIYFTIKAPPTNRLLLIALMLILGGIIGNLIDRVRLHVVIDFIELYLGEYHWPTFNLADAAICIGAVLLSIDILREPREAVSHSPEPADQQPKEGAGN